VFQGLLTESEVKIILQHYPKADPNCAPQERLPKKSFLKFAHLRTKGDQFSNQRFELLNRNRPIQIRVFADQATKILLLLYQRTEAIFSRRQVEKVATILVQLEFAWLAKF